MARSFITRSGASPRRAAHQPSRPLTRMAPSSRLLEEDGLLSFKIEGALEPLFEEQGMLPSFLELDGDGRLFTLQHVKISLTVHELQTAVNMMLAVAKAVETFEFYE